MSYGSSGVGGMGGSAGGGGSVDPELKRFLEVESKKAQFQGNVHTLTDMCWDKCIDKVPNRMDGRTEQCFTNCVGRFMDTTNLIVNKLTQFKT